jgi:peptidoglycan glycosyltransferase
VTDKHRRLRLGPALIVAACATAGLCFAARAQQGKPGLTEPAVRTAPTPPQDALDGVAPVDAPEPDDEINADDLAKAVGEAAAESDGGVSAPARVDSVPAAAANAVVQHTAHLQGLSLWKKAKLENGSYVAKTQDGKTAHLSIDPNLQAQMDKLLRTYKPQGAAVVALDPKTGKVLAMVEYGEGLAMKPLYPAASVFKIITGAALIEKGVNPEVETCYHGGMHGIVGKLLQDKPNLDRRCLSLSMALAKSANVVFAKMAAKHLDGDAALIAAAVGNGGVAEEPSMLDDVDGVDVAPTGSLRLLNAETAHTLRDMMKLTVSEGTASSSFRERHRYILGDIEVAGKTGSLSNHQRPFKDYSWFVGFAPANDPKIAVAAVVVNGLKWRIHAPFIAREALKAYLVGGPLGQPPAARVRRVAKRHKKRA